jgi:hypothetical protein
MLEKAFRTALVITSRPLPDRLEERNGLAESWSQSGEANREFRPVMLFRHQ